MYPILLGLGSNLGERFDNLTAAIEALSPEVTVRTISPTYETQPLYVTEQPEFLNLVVRGTTTLSPINLLALIKTIEAKIGRKRSIRFGPRIIDIDILFFNDLIVEKEGICIPHIHLHNRKFVLIPLSSPITSRILFDFS